MNELDALAIKYGTDKSSPHHNYTDIYYRLLNTNKSEIKNVLEIGIFQGNSLKMWRDFFQNATIYGVDINPQCKFEEERIITIIGNQTDVNFIKTLPDDFDLIIDDGGHQSTQQIGSFVLLFPKLKSGGMYIVEDTCCSYWSEYNVNSKQTTIEFFKTIIDHVNFFGYKNNNSVSRNRKFILEGKKNASEYEKNIDYIIFSNSLIFIKKI